MTPHPATPPPQPDSLLALFGRRPRLLVVDDQADSREALAALPDADSIPALYLVEEESRDIYRLVCRVVERQPRLYLQRVGRSRPTADVE
jgi:hypothetical protein